MSRSTKKGHFIDPKVLKKVQTIGQNWVIKTWSRSCVISPEFIWCTFSVHNGKDFIPVHVNENMVGHKLWEFSPTRKFRAHGGKQ